MEERCPLCPTHCPMTSRRCYPNDGTGSEVHVFKDFSQKKPEEKKN